MQHRLSPIRPHFDLEPGPVSQRIIASRPSICGPRSQIVERRPAKTRLICRKLHHISMSENQTSVADGTTSPGRTSPGEWIGQLVAAVILAEGIWGLLASLTNSLLVPLLAREMGTDPQSPLYLGKGEFNFPELFRSVLTLCLAGIVFVLMQEWSRKRRPRIKTVRVTNKVSHDLLHADARQSFPMASSDAVSAPAQTSSNALSRPETPQVPLQQKSASPSSVTSGKQAKPKTPKEVYYNIVGEPVNPTEND